MSRAWELSEQATLENTTALMQDVADLCRFNSNKGFIDLREQLLKFVIEKLEYHKGEYYTLQDIGQEIGAFVRGYKACHDYYSRKLNTIIT